MASIRNHIALKARMPSLSIKNVPDEALRRLRSHAERNHRSLQQELLAIVEAAAYGDGEFTLDDLVERPGSWACRLRVRRPGGSGRIAMAAEQALVCDASVSRPSPSASRTPGQRSRLCVRAGCWRRHYFGMRWPKWPCVSVLITRPARFCIASAGRQSSTADTDARALVAECDRACPC